MIEDVEPGLRLERLLRVLPDVPELVSLREGLLAGSVSDPELEWASAGRYITFDKRLVAHTALEEIVQSAKRHALLRVDQLYDGAARLLDAASGDDDAAVVGELLRCGQRAEDLDDGRQAGSCYALAATLSASLNGRDWLVLALRRLARVRLAAGEVDEARTLYRAALDQALDTGDRASRIIALTGIGNALSFQGRWSEARAHYDQGLLLCDDEDVHLQAQLHINLAMVLREMDQLDDAESQLQQARAAWHVMQPADRCGWYNFAGLVALSRAAFDDAESSFHRALVEASGEFERAMVIDNLVELAIRRQNFSEAADLGRRAERHALAAGSPRALAEIYTRLGRLFRLRGDANGVTFFEKALELCRRYRYPIVEATACAEYAAFREMLGDEDEARAYSDRAATLSREHGATPI